MARDSPTNSAQAANLSRQTKQRTAVMKRLQDLKAQGKALDTPANAAQAARFVPPNQNWISNIQPGDASFGNYSQQQQWSAYNMYDPGSYNQQFARYWDPLQTGNTSVDAASNQVIWQYAQIERAMAPGISAYQDTAGRLNTENQEALTSAKDWYVEGNTRMQNQSDQYYAWLGDYLQSQQGNQQAFAANEARRASGSQQAATAAGQRVGQTYVAQSLEAQQKKYAEDKSLLNELTNYIKQYNSDIKWSKDEYELAVKKNLMDMQERLATSIANQQLALISTNTSFDLNDMAAQRAFVRQQALNLSAPQETAWGTTTTVPNSNNTVAQGLNNLWGPVAVASMADGRTKYSDWSIR